MTRTRAALIGVVLLLGTLVAGCGQSSDGGDTPAAEHSPSAEDTAQAPVQVNTAKLRKAKQAAGIEACPRTDPDAQSVDGGLPAITLPCLGGGRSVNLAGLDGPMVLNFWAQTCGPCREESPILQKVHHRAGDKVDIVGVDFMDPRPGYAIAFADDLGLTYPQIADPGGETRAPLRIQGLPTTLFINRHGEIVYTHPGAITSIEELTDLIHTHLNVDLSGKTQ